MTDVRLTATNPEDSSVVPVACNAKGELKLEEPIAPPEFDGNLDGDLNVTGSATFSGDVKIGGTETAHVHLYGLGLAEFLRPDKDTYTQLNASVGNDRFTEGGVYSGGTKDFKWRLSNVDGSAEFADSVSAGGKVGNTSTETGVKLFPGGSVYASQLAGTSPVFYGMLNDGNTETSRINGDGSASFAGEVEIGDGSGSTDTGVKINPAGWMHLTRAAGTSMLFRGYTKDTGAETVSIQANGSATFSGEVTVGSKGSKWLIRESNGVAMLIEQTRRGAKEPRTEDVRDLPRELDLVEAALNEIMGKLKMTPPAGWPVWDGSDNPDETRTGTP